MPCLLVRKNSTLKTSCSDQIFQPSHPQEQGQALKTNKYKTVASEKKSDSDNIMSLFKISEVKYMDKKDSNLRIFIKCYL